MTILASNLPAKNVYTMLVGAQKHLIMKSILWKVVIFKVYKTLFLVFNNSNADKSMMVH